MAARIRAMLPANWFGDSTPVLDALLAGLGTAWSSIYGLLQYAIRQSRLASASDLWLEIIAADFLGARLPRRGLSDDLYRRRIRSEILRERGTRAAVSAVLADLTGRAPVIFEPARPADTGAYAARGGAPYGLAYGAAGGWGSLSLHFQAFVRAFRPVETGIPLVSGWTLRAGGYGCGALEYASLAMVQPQVADSDIYAAVASVLPAATIAWTRIEN